MRPMFCCCSSSPPEHSTDMRGRHAGSSQAEDTVTAAPLRAIDQFQARLAPSLSQGSWVLKVDGETGDAVYEEGFEAQFL